MARLLRGALTFFWLPVIVLVAWWFVSAVAPTVYLPSLRTILETLVRDWAGPHFARDALPSIGKFLVGFALAGLFGILIGMLIGMMPRVGAALDPLIQFYRAIPPPVLLPAALLLFGIGAPMNIALIVFGAIWPTLLSTIDGVRAVDPLLRDVAQSYRFSRSKRVFRLLLPAAAPQIFAGLRISLQISIILIVVAEMFGSTSGIGFYVLNAQQAYEVPETWAGTIVLGILGYLATLGFLAVENRILSWHHGLHGSLERV